MNDREAMQQALWALEKATRFMSDSDYKKLNETIEILRDALAEPDVPETDFGNMAATVAEPVSAGFKLVPLEPTPEMAKAGCYRYCAAFVKDYKAMIAAAPAAPPQREPTEPGWYVVLPPDFDTPTVRAFGRDRQWWIPLGKGNGEEGWMTGRPYKNWVGPIADIDAEQPFRAASAPKEQA